MSVRLREESPADAAAIHDVTVAAFGGEVHASHTEQFIVAALRAAGALTVSLVADAEGRVVAHVAASPVSISDGSEGWYGLGPVSVVPEHQGQGIGSRLVRQALDLLRERGAAGCVVLGEPAYYARFGFRPEPALVLADVPPQYFMALAFGASMPGGSISYHDAFDARQ